MKTFKELRDLHEENTDLHSVISKKIKEITGKTPKGFSLSSTYEEIDSGTLSSKQMGKVFAGIFKKVTYKILVGADEHNNYAAIRVKYDWEYFSGGRNGHTLQYNYDRTWDK